MQGRSWMAALTVASGLSLAAYADEPAAPASGAGAKPAPSQAPQAEPAPTPKIEASVKPYSVKLELRIAGLGVKGCDVDVKPAHSACKFRPKSQHIDSRGWATMEFKDVETESADRDCTFSITIREPGHANRTVHYGLQLRTSRDREHVRTCYLNSPSRIARAEQEAAAKRR